MVVFEGRTSAATAGRGEWRGTAVLGILSFFRLVPSGDTTWAKYAAGWMAHEYGPPWSELRGSGRLTESRRLLGEDYGPGSTK